MIQAKSDLKIFYQVLLWILITLLFYTGLRFEFLLWNWNTWFQDLSLTKIFWAFLNGLRFDLSSLTWLSVVVLIGALLPWPSVPGPWKEKTLRSVFLLIHGPFLFLNMLDSEFIHFAGRRMTPDSFYLVRESQGKLTALWSTYWHLILINSFLLGFFAFLILRTRLKSDRAIFLERTFAQWRWRLPWTTLFLIVLVMMARGGWQPKPLELAHAAALSTDFRLNHLALNSSFTTLHSLQKSRLKRLDYFRSTEELKPFLNAEQPGVEVLPWQRRPKNVVVFILESFGLEYTGLDHQNKKSFTPFLDSLKNNSLYFSHSYANGRRSIESLPSLLAGIPSLLDEPFLTGSFQTNLIPQIGQQLAERGIWSGFFHGGANGTMFFQEFTQRLGISNYFGKDEYPHPGDDDGSWGIWDGPFLNFFGNKLNEVPQPFLAIFFSLSSHHPFAVPAEFKDRLPEGPLPILKSIAYTDSVLKDFFLKYRNSSWFQETLFIFTADHTSKSYLAEYQTPLMSFRVPLLMYFPGAPFSQAREQLDVSEPVQHADLLPTLQFLFELPVQAPPLSRSLLKTGPRQVSVYLDGRQIQVARSSSLDLPTETAVQAFPLFAKDPLLPAWKAQRQMYINGLIDNVLIPQQPH